jgi:hypothetical protein
MVNHLPSSKRAHAYGAGARKRVGLACDGSWGALWWGTEAGWGRDVSAPHGSTCTGMGAQARADKRAG